MKLVDKYILQEAFKPFIVSLGVVTFIFLIDKIIELLNLIIEKRLDIATIVSVFSLSLPFIVALSVPMSVLVATIITFGRLSVDNELVAFKSCGINIYTLMRSCVIAAFFLSLLMIHFNNSILPDTNHKLKNLLIRVHQRRPVASIRAGTFTTIKNYTIFAFEVEADELRRVTIYNKEDVNYPATITAERGIIELTDGGNNFKATLYNGQIHERGKEDPHQYTISSFDTFILHLPDLGYQLNFEDSDYRGDREMLTSQMLAVNRDRESEMAAAEGEIERLDSRNIELHNEEQTPAIRREIERNTNMIRMNRNKIGDLEQRIREFRVEIQKKYAIAVACLIFVVMGVPIGMMIRTSGIGVAFTASTFIFIIYYIFLVSGEQLGDKGAVSPFIAMWAPNILFGIAGLYLVMLSTKETKTINFAGWFAFLKRLFTRKNRSSADHHDAGEGY